MMPTDIDLIATLAEERGERVTFVPPAQGGWEVVVGTTRSFPQSDIRTALHVAAQRMQVDHSSRCPLCGLHLHMEIGRLRCRACAVNRATLTDETPATQRNIGGKTP